MKQAKVIKTGIHPFAAKEIAGEVNAAVSAAGSTATDATLITAEINRLTTVGASTGVIIPPSQPGDAYDFYNSSGTTALIYPPTGATINASAASLSVPTAKSCRIVFDSATHCFSIPVVPS